MDEETERREEFPQSIRDWDARFRENEDTWFFGRQPSEPAQLTTRYWTFFRGEQRGRVLDLGSGEGRDAVHFTRHGFTVTAIDGSEAGIRKTKRLAQENGVEIADLRQMDVRQFPLGPGYDILYSNNCLQFLGDECLPTLRKIQAVTPPGGFNTISVFTREAEALVGRTDLYRFDHNELKFHYQDWRLLYYSEDLVWRHPQNIYLSFAMILAEKTTGQ